MKSFSIDKDRKKKELWENDKSKWDIFKINLGVKWRRFQTQTHNMGLIMLLFFGMLVLITMMQYVFNYMESQQLKKERIRQEIIIGRCDIGDRCYKFA